MRATLLKISRAIFNWPPQPAPSQEKQGLITRFGREWGIKNFIETGTFQGNMVEAQREYFSTIATIELGDELYAAAKERFSACPQIHVLHGDSGRMLSEALLLMEGPILFWLDAHYSMGVTARGEEEAPILKELSVITARGEVGDVILIDDARLFGFRPGYPRLATVREIIARHWPTYSVRVESDIICITPPAAK